MSAAPSLVHPDNDLMVLDTPLLRVSRPVAACSRCRAAKVKCDGKLPACTACEKSNRAAECSSTNDQFARGKERSYVATLEARVERLEKKIAEARSRRKSSSVSMKDSDVAEPSRRTSVDTLRAKPASKRALLRKEASDIDDLVSDFGLLAVNATARDFYGFTSAMSYARLILFSSAKEALPSGMTKQLPPRYAATPLIQHYLNNVFMLLPLFDEASLYTSVDAVYHQDQENATAFDHWTVRMVLAISCLLQSEQRGDTLYADAVGHLCTALEHAEDVLHPGFISSIQAMILLVEYAMLDPHHFDSWTLIGAASRAMVDLGIHQDPSRSTAISRTKLEIRRRVYWCVYALDRSTSLVQTRAFSFSDDSAHVALPFGSTSISPAKSSPKAQVWLQSFDTALDLFKLRQIQSGWYMDLFQSGRTPWSEPYPYIWKTYNAMTTWFQSLPSSILPSTKSFFELELLYSYVYILSPSPRIPHINEYAQRLIFEHCIAYATNLLALISKPSNTTKPPVTFYDAMRAYMTGRQFVDVLARNQDAILDPIPPTPPPPSMPPSASGDPLAPPDQAPAPAFPAPVLPDGQTSLDPTHRAINAINDFMAILCRFGLRFGYINWRDRFQRESAALLAQLYHRASLSPTQSPHGGAVQPVAVHPQAPATYFAPQQAAQQQQSWGTMGHSPGAATGMYNATTPPATYPPQTHSPFGTSPFAPHTPTHGAAQGYNPQQWTSPQQQQMPQQRRQASGAGSGLPDMPLPSDGVVRRGFMIGGDPAGMVVGGAGNEMAKTGWETLPGGSLNARFM